MLSGRSFSAENKETIVDDYKTKSETFRLSEYHFTDICFRDDGEEAYIRGLSTGDNLPMESIPLYLKYDLNKLMEQVSHIGKSEMEFFVDFDGVRYRVARADTVEGVYYALRRAIHPVPRFGHIGIHQQVGRYLMSLGRRGSGLILFAGETGQGKTTTACSLLIEYMIKYGDIAVTVEDPPELKLHGPHGNAGMCWQLQVRNGDFGQSMKQTMRYNPRYILLGEVRSPDEASEALRAAINGHLVITTIHAGSVQEAINSLLKKVAGKEPLALARSVLADGLTGVIQQRLIRSKDRFNLRSQFLFSGMGSSVKTKIREGKVEQLSTDIENQATRIMHGRSPVGD